MAHASRLQSVPLESHARRTLVAAARGRRAARLLGLWNDDRRTASDVGAIRRYPSAGASIPRRVVAARR